MALWVDKYRPTKLDDLSYHKDQVEKIRCMVKEDNFPHLLVHGPTGAGKKTRIRCILSELYGVGAERLRLETKAFQTVSKKTIDIQTLSSNYHIELSPGDAGIHDRVVIQEIVKQMAQSAQLDTSQKPFKVLVLMDVDRLTRDAQHALRRTMEKYSANCRLILCCESLSRVIEPLQSRCVSIRVAAPSDEEIKKIALKVAESEKVSIPSTVLTEVIQKAHGNLRKCLLMIEAAKAQNYPIKENQTVPIPEWQFFIKETAELMIRTQKNETVLAVRERLYEILSRCIPATRVFEELIKALVPFCSNEVLGKMVIEAASCEHRMCKGQKAIFHLEAFVVAFMDIYATELLSKKSK
ncbi:unnamed protein product [Auanema sp. JU1783]|nr:unnamed protein product [Auanema sp. JU1783]